MQFCWLILYPCHQNLTSCNCHSLGTVKWNNLGLGLPLSRSGCCVMDGVIIQPQCQPFAAQRKHCTPNIIDQLLGCPQIKYVMSLIALRRSSLSSLLKSAEPQRLRSCLITSLVQEFRLWSEYSLYLQCWKRFFSPVVLKRFFPLSRQSGWEQMAPPPLFFPTR